MNTKNRGLQVSILAGLVAIVLVVAALVLHVVDTDMTETTDSGHATTPAGDRAGAATDTTAAPTTHETMIMPDGSVMYMDDMPATSTQHGDTESAAAGEAAGHDSMEGMSMGHIDWQVILLILALVAAGIALGTAIGAYLRRQIDSGALAQAEVGCE